MTRWLLPLVATGTGLYVMFHNVPAAATSQIVLPFTDLLVGPDLRAQGQATWLILMGIGLLAGAQQGISVLRRPPPGSDDRSS